MSSTGHGASSFNPIYGKHLYSTRCAVICVFSQTCVSQSSDIGRFASLFESQVPAASVSCYTSSMHPGTITWNRFIFRFHVGVVTGIAVPTSPHDSGIAGIAWLWQTATPWKAGVAEKC